MKTTHFRFKTPCRGRIYDDGVFEGTPYENEGQEISSTTMARLYARRPELSQFLERNKEEMTQYIDSENKPLEDVVRLELGDYGVFNGRFYLIHHVWIKGQIDEISEEELQAVEEYIMGQLSDGWGEGLEQREWLNHPVEWSRPYFDEDSAEFEDEDFRGTVSYYVVPWNAEMTITQLDSEECELDVSAELIATMERKEGRFTRYVMSVKTELELQTVVEELKVKNPNRIKECVGEYGYPMLLAFNKYFDDGGDLTFCDNAFAVDGHRYNVFAVDGHCYEYKLYRTSNYSDDPVKNLRIYDAVTELLKA